MGEAELRATIDLVLAELGAELTRRGNAMAVDGMLDPHLAAQSADILVEALTTLVPEAVSGLLSVEYGSPEALAQIGMQEAQRDMHPAEPLMAAEVLFGVALPHLVGLVTATHPGTDVVEISQTLHDALWRRFPPGAVAYVETLRARLESVHAESRRRVARELHDRIAHGIAAGMQRVELADAATRTGRTEDAVAQLALAEAALRAALAEVRGMASELRFTADGRPIDAALAEYAELTADLRPALTLVESGAPFPLAASVAEELAAVAVEAIRNARRHAAGASRILVSTGWSADAIEIDVVDDGAGFDPRATSGAGLGLTGLRERAATIGAEVRLTTGADGTRVSIRWSAVLRRGANGLGGAA